MTTLANFRKSNHPTELRCCFRTTIIIVIVTVLLIIIQIFQMDSTNSINPTLISKHPPHQNYKVITNNQFTEECYLSLNANKTNFNYFNSSILTQNCSKHYCDLVSAFGSYCNQLTLFWFHRLLYSQLFLSTKVPKHIFISINGIKEKHCTMYNRIKYYYKIFASFVSIYFDNEVKILLYFHDQLMSAAKQRNFLSLKINEYFLNSSYKTKMYQKYGGNIIISYFDSDDITHPQKFEIFDYLYKNRKINGTILHRFVRIHCARTNYFSGSMWWYNEQKEMEMLYSRYNQNMQLYPPFNNDTLDSEVIHIDFELYYYMYNFHLIQVDKLLDIYRFNNYKINNSYIDKLLSPKLTRSVLINQFSYPGLNMNNFPSDFGAFGHINNDFWKKKGIYYSYGWPTITLKSILTNPFDITLAKGEDIKFNFQTLLYGFDHYLFPLHLGIYCVGTVPNKQSVHDHQ